MSQDTEWPVDAASGKPRPPMAQPGYYPGFSTLDQQAFWDESTRNVVLQRVTRIPTIQFFTPSEVRCLQAVFDRLLPQSDRDEAHRIPILNFVDARLHSNRIEGYRFDTMPPDGDAYRLGVVAIEALAQAEKQTSFATLDSTTQDKVLKSIHDGCPAAAHAIWKELPTHLFWTMMLSDAVAVYYAHPWAWDEIGFGGPAYPRAYTRLERGRPEPWEVEEVRYHWKAPSTSLSDCFEPIGGLSEHGGPAGQGGLH